MPVAARYIKGRSKVVLRSFCTAILSVSVAILVFQGLCAVFGRPQGQSIYFISAFVCSSALLAVGSVTMHLARVSVRRERQKDMQRWLLVSLCLGTLFVGIQSFGLWALFPEKHSTSEASLGVTPFVGALTALHAMHFFVATLFVSFVLNQAIAGRYDHEYYWGLTFCAWFWHGLGIVWVAILAVFSITLQ